MFCLGSTHPRAIAVDAEPSSTSAFQGLVRIVATTTKIGTGGRSGPARARTFSTPTAAPSYSQSTSSRLCGGAWVATLERPPFSGPVASAGELLHTPWRVPTSVATVLLSGAIDTFLWDLMSVDSGTSAPAFGSSRIASSAYQKWPTGHCPHSTNGGAAFSKSGRLPPSSPIPSLRSRRGGTSAPRAKSLALPDETARECQLS